MTRVLLSCLFVGGSAVRVQNDDLLADFTKLTKDVSKEQKKAKDEDCHWLDCLAEDTKGIPLPDNAKTVPMLSYGKTLTMVVEDINNVNSLEIGWQDPLEAPNEGQEEKERWYRPDYKLDFVHDDHAMYGPAYKFCKEKHWEGCQKGCGWWRKGACKRRCLTNDHKAECFDYAGGKQVVVTGQYTAVGEKDWQMTYSWPHQLLDARNSGEPVTFEVTLELNPDVTDTHFDRDKKYWVLHTGMYKVRINGREVPELNKRRDMRRELLSETDTDRWASPNTVGVDWKEGHKAGASFNASVGSQGKCTTKCHADECTDNGVNKCLGVSGKNPNGASTFAGEQCNTYTTREEEKNGHGYVRRECSADKDQAFGTTHSCCNGFPVPLRDRSLEKLFNSQKDPKNPITPAGPWVSVVNGELGEQIAYDACRSYQGTLKYQHDIRNPQVCLDMAKRGEKVRIVDHVLSTTVRIVEDRIVRDKSFDKPAKQMMQVYRPLTDSTMWLPVGMFTRDYFTKEKTARLPEGYWGIDVNEEGFITHVGEGSLAAMQGVVANKFFITQIDEFAFGPGRWKDREGYAVTLTLSEVKQHLETGAKCVDEPGWVDVDNHDCNRYRSKLYCGLKGLLKENWKGHNRWFFWLKKYNITERVRKGSLISALDACCVCGGGMVAALEVVATTTTYAQFVGTEIGTEAPTPAPTPPPVVKSTCSNSNTCRNAGLGWMTRPGTEDDLCPERGCNRDMCCQSTCNAFLPCPEFFVFQDQNRNEVCEKNTCDHMATCCQINEDKAMQAIVDETCESCTMAEAISFDIPLLGSSNDKFQFPTNVALRDQCKRAIQLTVTAAARPLIATEQVHVEFPVRPEGEVLARVFIDPVNTTNKFMFRLNAQLRQTAGEDQAAGSQAHDAMLFAVSGFSMAKELSARMPELASVAKDGQVVTIGEITEPEVARMAKARGILGGSGVQDWVTVNMPWIDRAIAEYGLFNFFFLGCGGVLTLVICIIANMRNSDEDFRFDSDGVGAMGSAVSRASSRGSMRVGSMISGGTAVRSQTSGAQAANSSTRADRAVAASIKVNLCGMSPHYPVRDEPSDAMRFYREWSSGLLDVFHDIPQCGCAVFCGLCFWPWRMNVTVGSIGTVDGLCCKMTKDDNWLTTVFCALFYNIGFYFLTHKAYCVYGRQFYSIDGVCAADIFKIDLPGTALDTHVERLDVSVALILMLPMVWRQVIMHKGIASRFQIQENDIVAYLKVILLLPFTSMQSGRHVDTYYKEHTVKRTPDTPKLPLIGRPIKIRPGPQVEDPLEDEDLVASPKAMAAAEAEDSS